VIINTAPAHDLCEGLFVLQDVKVKFQ